MTMYAMVNLQILSMTANQFTGRIPESFGDLSHLQKLDLAGNALSGEVPTSLGQLTDLQRLQLDGNNFEGEMPSEVCGLKDGRLGLLLSDCATGDIKCECCTDCF